MYSISFYVGNHDNLKQVIQSILSITKEIKNKNFCFNLFVSLKRNNNNLKLLKEIILEKNKIGWNFNIVYPQTDSNLKETYLVKKDIKATLNKTLTILYSKINGYKYNIIMDCDMLVIGNLNKALEKLSDDFAIMWTKTDLNKSRRTFLSKYGVDIIEKHNNVHGNGGFTVVNNDKFFEILDNNFNSNGTDLVNLYNRVTKIHLNRFKRIPFLFTLRSKCDELFYHQFIDLEYISTEIGQNFNVNRLFDINDYVKQYETKNIEVFVLHYMSVGKWYTDLIDNIESATIDKYSRLLERQHNSFKDNYVKSTDWTKKTLEILKNNKLV